MALLPKAWSRKNRERRAVRFSQPLDTRWRRFYAWMDMVFVDHGIFRLIYLNFHRIDASAWRSAQPAPGHFKRYARAGIKTVIYLRGGVEFGSWPLEQRAAADAGMALERFSLRSRALPTAQELRAFCELLRTVEGPVVMHCKSGADRAGFASALYVALILGRPIAEARRQLSVRYGHFASSKTGVLDAFFDTYERDAAETPMDLQEWIDTRYDPDAIERDFRPSLGPSMLVDWAMRRE